MGNELNKNREEKETVREEKKTGTNQNPSEENLKNNKNGRKSIAFSILACLLYAAALMLVVSAFGSNFFLGFLSIFLIPLVTIVQKKAVYLAQTQREINGKGFFALIFAKYLVPLLAICAILGLIFGLKFLIKF